MKNFNVRLISIFFLLLIFVFFLIAENFWFVFILQSLLFLTLWEYIRLVRYRLNAKKFSTNTIFFLTRQKIDFFDYLIIFLIILLNIIFSLNGFVFNDYFFLTLVVVIVCLLLIFFSHIEIFGLIYFATPFFFLAYYKINYDFSYFILFIISFSFFTDSGAYTFGNLIGGKKPFKSISPNKTVSGFVGGIITPLFFFNFFFYNSLYLLDYFIIILLSLLVQSGDLIESYIKRICFVKESSNLIPGHGGVLDRLDGIFLLISGVSILNVLGFNFFFMR